MNQPQPLCVRLDFQGYLVCQIPKDTLEVELKIKTCVVGSPYTQINSPGQKNLEHGGKSIDIRYIPEEGNTT